MGKYSKQLFSLSNWLIVAAIVYLWVNYIYSDTSGSHQKSKTLSSVITNKNTLLNNGSVSRFHIFGHADQKTQSSSGSQNQSSFNLVLNGTMSLSDDQMGLAFITDSQGQQKKFKVGDKVFNLATLGGIYKSYVILNNNGKKEKLSLPDISQVKNYSTSVVKKGKKPAYLKHLNGVEQRSWQEMMAQQKFDPSKISSIVGNMNMVVDKAGDINGIRVSNLAQGSLLAKNGLKSNDIITAINGNNVSSKNLLSIQETLKKDPNAIISVKRNGRIQNIKVNINNL